jgi:hypothetical protein
MGRKVFQPEIKNLCEKIAVAVTNRMITYRWSIKSDTGSIPTLIPSNELWAWKIEQIQWRSSNPFTYLEATRNLTFVAIPREEQDVVSVYQQLIGAGIIRGIKFFGSTHHDRYDALVLTKYETADLYSEGNALGVRSDIGVGVESEPKVLEFKKTFDSIVDDIENEEKFENQIDIVVCWDIESRYTRKYTLKTLLIEGEGNTRQFFGATHQAYAAGIDTPVFEVCALRDLLELYKDKDHLLAEHRTSFYE